MNDSKHARHRLDPGRATRLAHETLEIEAAAVLGLRSRLDADFTRAVELMLNVAGRVVVMGMGKSGHIGRKMAATLARPAPRPCSCTRPRPAMATWA